ncbi:MAG: tetratricopeptide repeat protein [Burkholderiaceae bacterium]|nr:tetratricopeptide repeat protein [Burkholderiaceae bacterium]
MAYNLEEQEQLENLKAFWNRYGNFLVTVVTLLALAIAGWRGWGWYQERQSVQAAAVYETLREAASERNVDGVRAAAGKLFDEYGRTVYGPMAALVAAGAYLQSGDAKAAKIPLQWAIDNADDADFRLTARLRLASILLDEGAYDEGLKTLEVESPGAYLALYEDRRGDLLSAAGRRDEARAAYERALASLAPNAALRGIVQLKLDALGGVPA